MKPKQTYHLNVTRFVGLLLLWAFFQVFGCRTVAELPLTVKDPEKTHPDKIALEIANQALQKGDFKKALEGFEILQHSADERIARKAFYGRACTYLSLAEAPDEVKEALILWQAWSDLAPSDLENEDPRSLGPFIKNKLHIKKNKDIKVKEPATQKIKEYEAQLQNKEKEIEGLNNQVKLMENEIQAILKSHTVYMGEMEKEIQMLKEKIRSLEAIDQKMKEKKKEVSSQ